jgi:hypothetical protein
MSVIQVGGRDFIEGEHGQLVDQADTDGPLIPPGKPDMPAAQWQALADNEAQPADARFSDAVNAANARAAEAARKRLGLEEPVIDGLFETNDPVYKVMREPPLNGLRRRALAPMHAAMAPVAAAIARMGSYKEQAPESGQERATIERLKNAAAVAALGVIETARGDVAKKFPRPVAALPTGASAEIFAALTAQLTSGDIGAALSMAEDCALLEHGVAGQVAVFALRGPIARLARRDVGRPYANRINAVLDFLDRIDPYVEAMALHRAAFEVYNDHRKAVIAAIRDWIADPTVAPDPVAE